MKTIEKHSDTIGGILISQTGCWIATSSGGPKGKQPGRVGSSAIKGAGFDFFKIDDTEVVATMGTGHGEYLIESLACREACNEQDAR